MFLKMVTFTTKSMKVIISNFVDYLQKLMMFYGLVGWLLAVDAEKLRVKGHDIS
jgi:hypothetical protein